MVVVDRRKTVALKRAKVVLFTLVVVAFAPVLLRSVCLCSSSSSVSSSSSLSRMSSATVTRAPSAVSEAALIEQALSRPHRVSRAVVLWEESTAPLWLLGRPKCSAQSLSSSNQKAFLCEFNRMVWSSLDRVQHGSGPLECPAAPTAVIGCDLGWATGLGHHIHHLGHCLTHSLMHQRPVVLVDADWSYGRGCKKDPSDHAFECFFTRFANQCKLILGLKEATHSALASRRTRDGKNTMRYFTWGPSPASSYWISPELKKECPSPDPPLALKAAILRYAFGLKQDVFGDFLNALAKQIGLRRPYCGIHIRRGDKIGTEAERHELHEYLSAALHLVPHLPNSTHRLQVFVATDDPTVLEEGLIRYSGVFEFVVLPDAAVMAAKGYSTVSGDGTRFTIADIAFLAGADWLVGTFSSQISRLAFELMSSQRNVTYVYAEKAAATDETPIMFMSAGGTFRLPNDRHKGIPVRAASLDSGYYYGSS